MSRRIMQLGVIVGSMVVLTGLAAAANCGDGIKPCVCGDTVRSTWTMTASLGPCSGHGLIIGDNGRLNMQNFTIQGDGGTDDDWGIYFNGASGGNCWVVGNGSAHITGFKRGIRAVSSDTCLVSGVVATGNSQYGLELGSTAHHFTVADSVFQFNNDEGVHLSSGTHHNSLQRNIIRYNASEELYLLNSDDNDFLENDIYEDSGSSTLVFLKGDSGNGTVGNYFELNTFSNGVVHLSHNSDLNHLFNNHFVNARWKVSGFSSTLYPNGNHLQAATMSGSICVDLSNTVNNLISQSTLGCTTWDLQCVGTFVNTVNSVTTSSFDQVDTNAGCSWN